jgi:hypothetical protein
MTIQWEGSRSYPWPSQIAALDGLEQFSLSIASNKHVSQVLAAHLATLSRNLKELILNFVPSIDSFKDLLSTNLGHFHHLEKLFLRLEGDAEEIPIEIPRTVTDLELRSSPGEYLSMPLSLLPPYITRFSCTLKWLDLNCCFPKTLQILDLGLHHFNRWPLVFHQLPTEIERISLRSSIKGDPLTDKEWTALSSFTKLKFLEFRVSGSFDVKQAQMLPKSIEKLYLERIDCAKTNEWCIRILETLSQNKNLKRIEGTWPSVIYPEVAKKIPRTLEMIEYQQIAHTAIAFMPDGYHTMEIFFSGDFGDVPTFPSKLTSLTTPRLPIRMAEKLPNHLKSLKVYKVEWTSELVEKLPRNLATLQSDFLLNPIADIEGFLKSLPQGLTSLGEFDQASLENPAFVSTPSGSSQYFPRGIKRLDIGCLDFSESNMAEWFLGLPTRLTNLALSVKDLQIGVFASLSNLNALKLLRIYVVNDSNGSWAQYLDFSLLSRNLRSLHLAEVSRGFKASDITNDTLKGVPPSLKILVIPNAPLLTSDCLPHLPPQLKKLLFFPQGRSPVWFR